MKPQGCETSERRIVAMVSNAVPAGHRFEPRETNDRRGPRRGIDSISLGQPTGHDHKGAKCLTCRRLRRKVSDERAQPGTLDASSRVARYGTFDRPLPALPDSPETVDEEVVGDVMPTPPDGVEVAEATEQAWKIVG